MKKIILLFVLFTAYQSYPQKKLMTTKAIINFEASVPFFEAVEAVNNQVICDFVPKTSVITCVAIVKKFEFERDLMRTHFNANYMESDRYKEASFKGIIEKFDMKDINAVAKDYQLKGELKIHGKSKKIIVPAKIKMTDKGIEIISQFALNTDDFNIEIPSVVKRKISKNVNTKVYCVLQ